MNNNDFVFNLRGQDVYSLNPRLENRSLDKLPVGVYILRYDPMMGFLFEKIGDRFQFPFKKYPIDDEFISHVIKRYSSMKKNFGILLNGSKGAGKSVISKTIANELGLPIVIVGSNFPNLGEEIISHLKYPMCFFFDEFEKIYGNGKLQSRSNDDDDDEEGIRRRKKNSTAGEGLLPILDGAFSNDVPHVFLFTTNELYINPNLISRPGRILYTRTYKNLNPDIVKSFIKDNLKFPEYEEELLREVSQLKIITIDIVKAIVDEVNIMQISPSTALEYLNIERAGKVVPYYMAEFWENNTDSYWRTSDISDFPSFEEFKKVINEGTLCLVSECNNKDRRRAKSFVEVEDEEGETVAKKKASSRSERDKIMQKITKWGVDCKTLNSEYSENFIIPSKLKPADTISIGNFGSSYIVLEVLEGGHYVKAQRADGNITVWIFFPNPDGKRIGESIVY